MKQKRLISFVVSLFLIGALLPASSTHALVQGALPGLSFAGIVTSRIPCTCSIGMSWIWFTPLYLGGPAVSTGALVYSPYSTTLYANLMIGVPSKYHMGSYLPGVQACWIRAGYFCLPLPSLGLMNKVGTN